MSDNHKPIVSAKKCTLVVQNSLSLFPELCPTCWGFTESWARDLEQDILPLKGVAHVRAYQVVGINQVTDW